MKQTLPITVITGPTASGKTNLAIEFAKKTGAEIICADSRIMYKNLDIVSAKPSFEERQGVIHHLIDIKNVNEGVYSAWDFIRDASKIIKNADCPIVIQGGTWFYIKSLLDEKRLIGFGENKKFRESLAGFSNEDLWNMLNEKDSLRAQAIHKNNRDKVIRSLELIKAIGGKLSEYERKQNCRYKAVWYMQEWDRDDLYKRIDLRVDIMVNSGLYGEWRQNREKYGRLDILYNTIGYHELFELEDNVWMDFETAAGKIKQRTRNFAKRQLAWFRQNKAAFNIRPATELFSSIL